MANSDQVVLVVLAVLSGKDERLAIFVTVQGLALTAFEIMRSVLQHVLLVTFLDC